MSETTPPQPLRRDPLAPPVEPALEDDPIVSEAAYSDEATVPGLDPPGGPGPQDDGMTPDFSAPDA